MIASNGTTTSQKADYQSTAAVAWPADSVAHVGTWSDPLGGSPRNFDLVFDLSAVSGAEECRVAVAGDTPGELLVAWLSALLAEAEIRGLAFYRFRVDAVGGGRLVGAAAGAPSDILELRGPPVKAVTYHDLAVEEAPGGWEVRVIFDV